MNLKGIKKAKIASYLLSLFLLVSGMMILFIPKMASQLYDLSDSTLFDHTLAKGMGIRQLTMGLVIFALLYLNQLKPLANVLITSTLIPFTDFFIFGPETGWISASRHLVSIPIIIGLGIYFHKQI